MKNSLIIEFNVRKLLNINKSNDTYSIVRKFLSILSFANDACQNVGRNRQPGFTIGGRLFSINKELQLLSIEKIAARIVLIRLFHEENKNN